MGKRDEAGKTGTPQYEPGVTLRDFRDKRAASLSLRRAARAALVLADTLCPRTPPLPLESWSNDSLLCLLRDVQDDVRSGAVSRGSDEEAGRSVRETLARAGLNVSPIPAPDDEDAPPPLGEP